jgi:hypothetical protein
VIRHLLDTLKNSIEVALSSPALNLFFGPTIPNHTRPASTVSMPDEIPENILVFRTMTTLLAQLPRTVPIPPTDNFQQPAWQFKQTRQELKISDAFAQLAVSQHDVVAVSTVRGWRGLGLVTCVDQDATETQAESTSLLAKLRNVAWRFFITRNDRPDDPATSSGDYPTIVPSEEPLDLNGRTAYKYMKDLEATW